MTRVWIELNYDEGLKHPLPIEIRRLDLALVARGISREEFELKEQSYFVTSTLPDGRKLFGQGTVTGEETTILVSVDPDYEQSESVDLFLPGQIRLGDRPGDLLLQYLANGYLQEAAILAQSELFNILFLGMDHSSQLVLLYTLLRVGELDKLTNKIFESKFTSPDSSAIRGEVLARLGRHQEAFEAFLELESPVCPNPLTEFSTPRND